jgi:hypothetical protein
LFRKEKKKAGNIQDQKLCYVIDWYNGRVE